MPSAVALPDFSQQPRMRRSAFIAGQLRDMIFTGRLKPGDRLPTEEQLCRHFGVSRTTLRESVQMLRVSGLLDVTPGRGSFVCLPDLSNLIRDLTLFGRYSNAGADEVAPLRALIQTEMARKACLAPLEEKKRLNLHTISRSATPEENEAAESEWHLTIADLAGNRMARTLLEALLSMMRHQNVQKYADSDEIMRTMSMQIRLNATILEGNQAAAARIMAGFLGEPVPTH